MKSLFWIFTINLVLFSRFSLGAFDDVPLWRLALGGKIDTLPAQGPNGNIYIVADDRGLHAVDSPTGTSLWTYRPGGRLENVLLVGPDNTIYIQNDRQEIFAVTPGGTGRWKFNMKTNAASLPAIGTSGRLLIPLNGGRIVCITRHGRIIWSVEETSDASGAPVTDEFGNFWVPLFDNRIIGLNTWGVTIAELNGIGPASVLAMDIAGRLWAGGFSGELAVYDLPEANWVTEQNTEPLVVKPKFKMTGEGYRIHAIHTDENSTGRIFFIHGTQILIDRNGKEILRMKSVAGRGQPSRGGDGTLFLSTSNGSIQVVEKNDKTVEFGQGSELSEHLLTDDGQIVAGGADWILYSWAALPAAPGWSQFRGNSRRTGELHIGKVHNVRLDAIDDPAYKIRHDKAISDDTDDRKELLDELESFKDEFEMRKKIPWANLLLDDLSTFKKPGSDPIIRVRVYKLWGKAEDFRVIYNLRERLKNENDLTAIIAGIRALGQQGTDWDGASMRLISKLYENQVPKDPQLALATAEALAGLIRYNGRISDPIGNGLLVALLQYANRNPIGEDILNELRNLSGI